MMECKLEEGAMESLPFLALRTIGVLVLTYYPPLSLASPGLLMR